MPQNLVSRRPYRGVNVFLLHAMAYQSPYWLTFKQAQEMGGNVRRGEHACPVVFRKWLDVDDRSEPTGKRRVPMLRYYSVFEEGNPKPTAGRRFADQPWLLCGYFLRLVLEKSPRGT